MTNNECEHEPFDIPWGYDEEHFAELFNESGDKVVRIFLCEKCHAVYWEDVRDGGQ